MNGMQNDGVVETSQTVRLVRRIAATIPPLFFAYLEFSGVDIKPIVSDLTADWIRKIALFTYYIGWVIGTLYDIQKQESIYARAPRSFKSKTIINTIFFAALITGIFGILCWVGNDYRKISIFLSCFWFVNFIGWFVMKKIVTPPIEASESYYKSIEDISRYIKLKFVDEYIRGNWQIYRFVFGIFLLIGYLYISFSHYSPIVNASAFLVFVLLVESWMYFVRLRLTAFLSSPEKISAFDLNISFRQNG